MITEVFVVWIFGVASALSLAMTVEARTQLDRLLCLCFLFVSLVFSVAAIVQAATRMHV